MSEKLKSELLERLAELEHEQWAHWVRYDAGHGTSENRRKWLSQAYTSYDNLSEKEKERDRVWARKTLDVVLPLLEQTDKEHKIQQDAAIKLIHHIEDKKRELEGRLEAIMAYIDKQIRELEQTDESDGMFNPQNLTHPYVTFKLEFLRKLKLEGLASSPDKLSEQEIADIEASEREIKEGKAKTFGSAEELIKDLHNGRKRHLASSGSTEKKEKKQP